MDVLLVGEGLVLHGVRGRVCELGHRVIGELVTASLPSMFDGGDTAPPQSRIDAFITEHPCDLLLSVANPYILSTLAIGRPRVAAVNYHNGPLPAYAGLRATAWAVANGEQEHGISWHLIDPSIDAGAVLVQKVFRLAEDETTATLDARCTAAAIDGVDELLSILGDGGFRGRPQDLRKRTYYGRRRIAPQAGIVDLSGSARDIVQLVRACDWGAAANDFGVAKLMVRGQLPAHVLAAEAGEGAGRSGQVLDVDGALLTVACGSGAVRFTLDRPVDVALGAILPGIDQAPSAEQIAAYDRSLLSERANLRLYQTTASAIAETVSSNAVGSIATSGNATDFMKAVSLVMGRAAIVAVAAASDTAGLLHDWAPCRAGNGLDAIPLPPCRDIHRRRPNLKGLERWPDSAAIRILGTGNVPGLLPGTISFDTAGLIHYSGCRATAEALAKAMTLPNPRTATDAANDAILARILALARERPASAAIEEGGVVTSYAALAERAGAVCAALMARGTQAEDGVGMLLPASTNFVTAALGAMLAGGAYVPLDPGSPARRLLVEIEGAGVTHIVTSRKFEPRLPASDANVLFIEDVIAGPSRRPLPEVASNSCAYRIFTSGSTGRPKAVEVTHSALANLVTHCCKALPLGPGDRVTMLARPTFDASVADVWPILTAGGTLLVPPPQILLDQANLLQWIASTRATCAFLPTVIAERVLHMPQPPGLALHTLLTGGDTLHRRPPAGLPYRVINSYGPTENTVASLWSVVSPGESRPRIGCPISGVTVQVVDGAGQSVPPGEIGELLLGGAQVARGYFGRPELTFERFPDQAGDVLYRTGDRVRLAADGKFEFHGRIDDQVQVLGIRAEPGEIETILLSDERVAEAACIPWPSIGQVSGLIAFVVPATPQADEDSLTGDLRGLLQGMLPAAIVPKFVRVEADLPYRSSGKIDRAALVRRVSDTHASSGDALDQAWRRALPHMADGETGNFWDLGGDSLAAIDLLLELETLGGFRISTGSFLADPTLTGLRRLLEDAPTSTAIQLRAGRSPTLVCWYGLTGDLAVYQHMLACLPGHRIIGILSPGLHSGSELPDSIERAAAIGLRDLETMVGGESIILLGFSFGGLLAFEAGRQLADRGQPPLFVGLFGTTPPVSPRSTLARLTYLSRRLPRFGWRILRGQQKVELSWSKIPGEVLGAMGLRRSQPALPVWAKSTILQKHHRIAEAYRPETARMPIHLFRETEDKDGIRLRYYVRKDLEDLGWSEWIDTPARVHWIDSDHENMLKHAVNDVALMLEREIDSLL